jgi:hypothetical protein
MRGTVAKQLRKKVYGTSSRRNVNEQHVHRSGQVVCTGKRGDYLEEKRAYKRGEQS